jgi:hypothetical protein
MAVVTGIDVPAAIPRRGTRPRGYIAPIGVQNTLIG